MNTLDLKTHMKPGPELDELVSIHIFGKTAKQAGYLSSYSSEPNCARKIVDEMAQRGYLFDIRPGNYVVVMKDKTNIVAEKFGESEPHAICLAALKAVGVEV